MKPRLVLSLFVLSALAERASAQCGQWDPAPGVPGFDQGSAGLVLCSQVYDDGSGPKLYAGGNFATAGGTVVNNLACFDGTSWGPLGLGANGLVRAMAVYHDGASSKLYVGGDFSTIDGVPAFRLASFDGTNWAQVGTNLNGTATIRSLRVAPLGPGGQSLLFVGGNYFHPAGTSGANHYGILGWDGAGWIPLGGTGAVSVLAMDSWDSNGAAPGGLELVITGNFTTVSGVAAQRAAAWNGVAWSAMGPGLSHAGYAVAGVNGGPADGVYVGGGIHSSGTTLLNNVGRWDGATWTGVGGGVDNAGISSLAAHDDGNGLKLYAGGPFSSAGGMTMNRIARWDGANWASVGSGIDLVNGNETVTSLHSTTDAHGPALIAGGDWKRIDLLTTNRIATWRGTSVGVNYCAAKVTSGGCLPTMSASGTPSLGAPGGFAIATTGVKPGVNGLTFFSLSGPASKPFQGGQMCMNAPRYRLAIKDSGGSASCTGSYVYTLADVIGHASGGALVGTGSRLELQTWFRDPQSPSSTGLSDALDVYVCP